LLLLPPLVSRHSLTNAALLPFVFGAVGGCLVLLLAQLVLLVWLAFSAKAAPCAACGTAGRGRLLLRLCAITRLIVLNASAQELLPIQFRVFFKLRAFSIRKVQVTTLAILRFFDTEIYLYDFVFDFHDFLSMMRLEGRVRFLLGSILRIRQSA
jgi:hypothetical protein